MLHVATGNTDIDYSRLEPNPQGSSTLKEAVRILNNENEPRHLESHATVFFDVLVC